MIKCGDEYWIFATGRGIPSWHSRDLRNWSPGPRIFTNPPAWTTNRIVGNRGNFWAPDVCFQSNRFLLYYAVSIFGKNTSAIGLASNPTLDPDDPRYQWSDEGMVLQSGSEDTFNAIDPAVCQDADGRLWLAFGSYWTGIKLIELNPATGLPIAKSSPIYSLAHHDSIEASYIYHHEGYYYLFVNWGQCCQGVRSTYNIRVGRSHAIQGPYHDKEGKDLLGSGGSLVLETQGPFIGPGHAGILADNGTEWFTCHYYDGLRQGESELAIFPLGWDADGWPTVTADRH